MSRCACGKIIPGSIDVPSDIAKNVEWCTCTTPLPERRTVHLPIRRDMRDVYERVKRAHHLIDPKKNPEAWDELDLAIVQMQRMGVFVLPPEDPNEAAHDAVSRL